MRQKIEEAGNKYGKLTVIKYSGSNKWECLCECGKIKFVTGCNLRLGHINHCGCSRKKQDNSHGFSKHRIYRAFNNAHRRCANPKSSNWHNYGGRGIEFKLGSVTEFVARMNDSWFEGASLGRINNDGHYEYGNIRWETNVEQSRNKRTNVFYSFDGRTLIIADWARCLGVHARTLACRIKKIGVERALSQSLK